MATDQKTRLSYLEGYLSIIVNFLLFALKLWAGTVSRSVAITADAWHTLSDSISSIVVIWGAKISKKPADKDHPFGHGRAELISAFVIGFLLLFVCYEFVVRSISSLLSQTETVFTTLAIIATVSSIVLKEIMAQLAFLWARKTDSKALKADGWHHRSDALSSIVILIGIFISKYYWWVDGVLGLIVSAFILYSAYEIIKDTISAIMGEHPDNDFISELKELGNKVSGRDIGIHHVHVHRYGDHMEMTFHIYLPSSFNLDECHDIASKVENAVMEKYGYIPTIHVEPNDHMENK
jgi:cation diffusion facilitator family transporter